MSFHRHEFQLDRLSPRRSSCRYDTHLRTAASKGGHLRRGVETPLVAPSFNCKVTRGSVSEGMAQERGENGVVFQSENRIYVRFLEVCPRRVGFSCCHPHSTGRTTVHKLCLAISRRLVTKKHVSFSRYVSNSSTRVMYIIFVLYSSEYIEKSLSIDQLI
jgi:hypothetical protein